MAKSFFLILGLCFILSACSVAADTFSLQYPYYMEVNVTENIVVADSNMSSDNVTAIINNTEYQMSKASTFWYLAVIAHSRENDNFTVKIYNDTGGLLLNVSGLMRWRVPFTVDIYLYHTRPIDNESDIKPYKNDFQYVYLQKAAAQNELYTWMDSDYLTFSWVDTWFSYLVGNNYVPVLDKTMSLWADYSDGKASIIVYEAANYSLNLESTDTKSSLSWPHEFYYPQSSGSKYKNHIMDLDINNETDQSYKIYISPWEISSSDALWNVSKVIGIIILYIAVVAATMLFTRNLYATSIVASVGLGIVITLLSWWT